MGITAVLLACMVAMCMAANVDVAWKIALDNSSLAVQCGDTITLTWAGTHDVAKSAAGCSGDPTVLAAPKSGGEYVYKVTATDDKFYLICTVGSHCASGQKLAVTSTCSTTNTTNTTSTTNTTKTNTTTSGTGNTTNTTDTKKKNDGLLFANVSFNTFFVAAILAAVGVLLV